MCELQSALLIREKYLKWRYSLAIIERPRGTAPPIQMPFRFEAATLSRFRSPVISRSNWAKDSSTLNAR